MYLLIIEDDGLVKDLIIDPTPSMQGIRVEELPAIELKDDEIAKLYYKNGGLEFVKEKRK